MTETTEVSEEPPEPRLVVRTPPAGTAVAGPRLDLRLPASWVAPSIARDELKRWLESHRWPADDTDDAVYAVSEAVSNSVEHGYGVHAGGHDAPGEVIIEAHVVVNTNAGDRYVTISVRDHGRWRPISAEPTHRGCGLFLMRASMAHVDVRPSDKGTTVLIHTHICPAPARLSASR